MSDKQRLMLGRGLNTNLGGRVVIMKMGMMIVAQ
jgi:hypothetical protein